MRKLLYYSKNGVRIVSYTKKPSFEGFEVKDATIETVSQFVKKDDILSVSFESNLYTDTGEFLSLSELATYTAIKNSVNNLGLFAQDFEVSFRKLKSIDKTKATFFYAATSKDSFDFLDSLDCTVEQCVPVEIAIKNLFCNYYASELLILVIMEKEEFIEAIAFNKERLLAKRIIHKEGFGTENQELIQFAQNVISQYGIKNVYFLGSNELFDSLHNANIDASKPYFQFGKVKQPLDYIEVLGLLYKNEINFLTPKHKDRYEVFKHATIANKIAIIVFIVGILVYFIAFINYFNIISLKDKLNTALNVFQQNTGAVSINISSASLQNSINLYAQLQKTPRLDCILTELSSYKLPNLYFIEVKVSNNKVPDIQNGTLNQTLGGFVINIKGVVFGSLNTAKSQYSAFLTEVSKKYNIELSNFYYLEGKLLFDLKLEDENALS